MTKYYIDTSTLGSISKAKKIKQDDQDVIEPGNISVDYPIQVMVGGSNKFKLFCENVTLDGESLLYYDCTKSEQGQVIIPANTNIENYNTTNSFNYCKVVPYQTE